MIIGGYKRCEYLKCDCPEAGKFQSSHVLWANQHGQRRRFFCPNGCGHYVDIEIMAKNDWKDEIAHLGKIKR